MLKPPNIYTMRTHGSDGSVVNERVRAHTHTRARLYKISLSLEQQHLDQITDEKYFSIESDCKAAYFSYLSSSAAFCLFHLPSRLLSASFYFI